MSKGPCVCCGRMAHGAIKVDSGPIHMDCYVEHHCGPDVPWPPDHHCGITRDVEPMTEEVGMDEREAVGHE